jgi:hypothetical protein
MTEDKHQELYTDVMLELLSAYLFSTDSSGRDLTIQLMESVRKDPVLSGKGMMEGLVFSSVIHMSLMITLMAMMLGLGREDILKLYAMSYQMTRDKVALMPQVHPEIVNRLVEELDGLI